MGLEQGIAGKELDKDAANTPDVTRKAPTEIQDDLGSAVVTGRDYRRVILIFKGGRAEVDESNLGIKQDSTVLGRSRIGI